MKKKLNIALFLILSLSLVMCMTSCGGSSGSEALTSAKELSAEDLMAQCETVDYSELVNNADSYTDKLVKADVRIEQSLDDGYYRAYSGYGGDDPSNWYEDEYVLWDATDSGLGLAENDTVTVYGVYAGLTEVERALTGSTDNVPQISILQTGEVEALAAIRAMVEGISFEETTDEWGDKEYTAVVENTTGYDFGSFGIDVNFLDASGTKVGTDVDYTENWKSGEKTTFKYSWPPDETESIEIADFSYYSN